MDFALDEFVGFLLTAKKATYASQGDEASVEPLLAGFRQLEYQKGEYFYRDLYVGMSFFAGQESVYFRNEPIWTMTYGGGTGNEQRVFEVRAIYTFLREALSVVSQESPYRGPSTYVQAEYQYLNDNQGTLERFFGTEKILLKGKEVYSLQYCGGFTR
ncbi:hypothetical protein GJB61_16100 [Paenibacillus sp. LC-T2]|uniref:DUF5680 domain-containing protein n=2 Tax=Paenibacillus monticola TaxID=2666075 RepID=A0A7X2H6L7_9BACL|nr:hypothetical protein [Paenibacillus monticola]